MEKEETGTELLRKYLLEWRERLATEVGTEMGCPFCGVARVRRSDYVRCNGCGINWLDEERGLPGYLDRDPGLARHDARMVTGVSKSAVISGEGVEKG